MLFDAKIHPLYRAVSAVFPILLFAIINVIYITFCGTAFSVLFGAGASGASLLWTATSLLLVTPLYAMTLWCLYLSVSLDPGAVPPLQARLWRGLAREFSRRQYRGAPPAAAAPGGGGAGGAGAAAGAAAAPGAAQLSEGAGAMAAAAGDGCEDTERARLAGAAPPPPLGEGTVLVWEAPERLFTSPGPHDLRWCRRSGAVKPPRAHYCSTCDRLVLKMDHHCPWVANCVGYANYKAFCLLLAYGWLATALVAAWWLPLAAGWWAPLPGGGAPNDVFLFGRLGVADFLGLVLCLSFFATLSLFAGAHAWLVLKGRTTLESSLMNDGAFDFGAARNWALVFGARPRGWLWPHVTEDVHAATRRGVDFQRAVGEATRVRAEEYPLPEEAAV